MFEAAVSRVAGYGKKKVENLRQREKQEKLAQKIDVLQKQLKDEIDEINVHEQAIGNLIPKGRRLRAKTKIVKGKRILPNAIHDEFERYSKKHRHHQPSLPIMIGHSPKYKLM